MNVLAYLPGILYIMALTKGIWKSFLSFLMIGIMQYVWGLEFILYMKPQYLNTAYNFSRRFNMMYSQTYKWLQFPNNTLYHSETYMKILLLVSLVSLSFFLIKRWLPLVDPKGIFSIRKSLESLSIWPIRLCPKIKVLSPYYVGEVLFLSNFTSIVWARSIHPQFLIWYWFSIPFLMYAPLINNKIGLTELLLTMIILDGAYVIQILEVPSFASFALNIYYFILNCRAKTPGQAYADQKE